MDRTLLIHTVATASLLASCQARTIAIVECRTDADCPPGARCDGSHVCQNAGGSAGQAGGNAGQSAAEDGLVATPLLWSELGAVSPASNPFGIHGVWTSVDDCPEVMAAIAAGTLGCAADEPTPGCCTAWDASLVGPAPEFRAGLSVAASGAEPGKVCLKGTTPRIASDRYGAAAFGAQWGANVGLPLADWDGFDATLEFEGGPIVGFRMRIDGPPNAAELSVHLGVLDSFGYGVLVPIPAGEFTLLLDDLRPPEWLEDPPPFDRSKIYELVFGVGSSPSYATPFEFCVSDLRVLQAGPSTSGS